MSKYIDDMSDDYIDYMIENVLSPQVFIPLKNFKEVQIYTDKYTDWLDENSSAEYSVVYLNAGDYTYSSFDPIKENGFMIYFEQKTDAFAFKLRWV